MKRNETHIIGNAIRKKNHEYFTCTFDYISLYILKYLALKLSVFKNIEKWFLLLFCDTYLDSPFFSITKKKMLLNNRFFPRK